VEEFNKISIQRYEYSNHYGIHIQYDSYMVPENALPLGSFRLLEVDNYVMLPVGKSVRMLVTSTDVLHSWAVPSLGVKLDACPGRLNQVAIQLTRPGKFFGQCSEICGLNHGFMPIGVRGLVLPEYLLWYDASLLWEAYDILYPEDTEGTLDKIFAPIIENDSTKEFLIETSENEMEEEIPADITKEEEEIPVIEPSTTEEILQNILLGTLIFKTNLQNINTFIQKMMQKIKFYLFFIANLSFITFFLILILHI